MAEEHISDSGRRDVRATPEADFVTTLLAETDSGVGSPASRQIVEIARRLSRGGAPSGGDVRRAADQYYSAKSARMSRRHEVTVACEITSEPQPIPDLPAAPHDG